MRRARDGLSSARMGPALDPMDRLHPSRFHGAADGVEDSQIGDPLFTRGLRLTTFAHARREGVELTRDLIALGELLLPGFLALDLGPDGQVTGVVVRGIQADPAPSRRPP